MNLLNELTHGLPSVVVSYATMLLALFVMLWRYRASWGMYARALAFSPVLFLIAVVALVIVEAVVAQGFFSTLLHAVLPFAAGIVCVEFQYRFGGRRHADVHIRGARVYSGGHEQSATRRSEQRGRRVLTLAGIAVPAEDETKHFKLIGTTGSGKSTAIRELLKGALERGDRAIIADPDGGYLTRFFDRQRGDIVLNPFEPQSLKWDVFSEIRDPYDVEQHSSGIVPSVEDASGREWRGYARTFLTAVLRRCYQAGHHNPSELWRLLAMAPAEELRPIVANTPAQPFLEAANARMFGSLRSVAVSGAAALEYIQAQQAPPCSVRAWVREGTGTLFIPYKARQIAALRSMIATWMKLAIFEAMSQPENQDQRLWFVVDELDAVGAIDGLKDALARLRKFGGRCVLGFQSIAQVSSTYGAQEASTIVENCGTSLILRCSSSEGGGTAQFAAQLIGDRDVERTSHSRSRSSPDWFSGQAGSTSTGTNRSIIKENAVLPSEIEQLPDLTGLLKFPSWRGWMQVVIPRPRS